MRHITEVRLVGGEHLEHIESLHWYETAGPNAPDTGPLMRSPREEMYEHVKNSRMDGLEGAYALNKAKTHHAFLMDVKGAHVNYVKTVPDNTKSDNLLSLPRY